MKIKKERFGLIIKKETDQVLNEIFGDLWKSLTGGSKKEREAVVVKQLDDLINRLDKDNTIPGDVKQKVLQMVIKDPNHSNILVRDLDHHDTTKYVNSLAKLLGTASERPERYFTADIPTITKKLEDDEPEPDGDGKGGGPIPIFKDLRDEEGKRLGAKEGGQGLQALLQNWINKNAPQGTGGLDPKALQTAIRQIVQDVGKQLKANNIPIQEGKIIRYVLEAFGSLSGSKPQKGEKPEEEGEAAETPTEFEYSVSSDKLKRTDKESYGQMFAGWKQRYAKKKKVPPGERAGLFEKHIQELAAFLGPFKRDWSDTLSEEKAVDKLADSDHLRGQWPQFLQAYNALPDDHGAKIIINTMAKTGPKLKAAINNIFGALERKGVEPEAEEAEGEEELGDRGPVGLSLTLDGLQNRLKELDLDSDEGLYAASEEGNEQAYLGAYMFYKAIKKLQKALQADPNITDQAIWKLVRKEIEGGSPYSPKRTGPIREQEEDDDEGNRELIQWLDDTIRTFDKYQLNDPKRAVSASKKARRAKDDDITEPQGDETPEDVVKRVAAAVKDGKASKKDLAAAQQKVKAAEDETARGGKEGTFNTKQSVLPRLKQAGMDLNPKTNPEGDKLGRNLLRLIRRFIDRHFKRTGASVGTMITEEKKERMALRILEILLSKPRFRNIINEMQNTQ